MDYTIRLMKPEEYNFAYTQKQEIMDDSAYISHLRVDLVSSGQGFHTTWDDHRPELNSPEFKSEFDILINSLQAKDSTGSFLLDRDSLKAFCHQFPESILTDDGIEFGFLLDTDDYSYMIRLNPNRGEYAAYIYPYERDLLAFYLVPTQEEKPPEKITVLVIDPEAAPYDKEIDNTLDDLQSEVSGYVQAVYPFDDPVAILCNEDAKLIHLPPNRALYYDSGRIYDIIAGTFLVTGISESDFCSLTDDLIKKFSEQFHAPEAFIHIGGRVHVLKLKDNHEQKQSVMDKLKKPTVKDILKQKKKAKEEVR